MRHIFILLILIGSVLNVQASNPSSNLPSIYCPDDTTIGCDMDLNLHLFGQASPTSEELVNLTAPDFGTGVPFATVGPTYLTYADEYEEDLCYEALNEITRTWCIGGNPNNCCTQIIDIVPNFTFDYSTISWFSGYPESDITTTCLDDIEIQQPTWVPSACEFIGWTVQSDTFEISANACHKVINQYTVSNWCTDESWQFVQVIKLLDSEAPEVFSKADTVIAVSATPLNAGGTCSQIVTLEAIATDGGDCPSEDINWQVLVDLYNDWEYDYIFTTDTDEFDDNYATSKNELYIPPTQSGEPVRSGLSVSGITLPLPVWGSGYKHRVVWKASDNCGNVSSVTTYFEVKDLTAPTPYCIDIATADCDTVPIKAIDFDKGAFDNCSINNQLRFTFSDTPPNEDPAFDQNLRSAVTTIAELVANYDHTGESIDLNIFVWDQSDNYNFCTVKFNVKDCSTIVCLDYSTIQGLVTSYTGQPIDTFRMTIESPSQPEYPFNKIFTSGEYLFEENPSLNEYSIKASKQDDYRRGISTLDIVLMQRHILDINSLDNPYQYIAADANNDQNVTASDISELRKLILQINDELPNNTSWKFINPKDSLTLDNPFNYTEVIDIPVLDVNKYGQDFTGVKIGDVNGSLEFRDGKVLNLNLEEIYEDETIEIVVTSSNFEHMLGCQFTLDKKNVEFESIESGVLDVKDHNYAVINDQMITFSWNSTLPMSANDDEVLFTIKLRKKVDNVDRPISVNSLLTKAEAYNADLSILDINVNYNTKGFEVLPVYPNPFTERTHIPFTLSNASEVTFKIIDMSGREVYHITQMYPKGNSTMTLSRENIGVAGTYYYSFECNLDKARGKLILID